jgi:predicted kinase
MKVNEENIYREFKKTLIIPKKKLSPPLIIGLFGKICSGKSTVASALAIKIPLVILRSDVPRSMIINKYGIEYNTIARVKRIILKMGKELLGRQHSILVDAGNIGAVNRNIFQKIAKKFNSNVIWLHITCPEKTILKRLRKRRSIKNTLLDYEVLAGEKIYYERKKIYNINKRRIKFFATINTAKPLSPQINKLVKQLS